MKNTVAAVNAELRKRGEQAKLRRGRGYYYFDGGACASWFSSSVSVFRADSLSVERWMAEFDNLKNDYRNQ